MNALVRIARARQVLHHATPATFVAPEGEALGDIEDFRLCCADQRYFLDLGIIELAVAVDNLQWLAERWDLIGPYGQDEIQRIIAVEVGADEIPLAPEPPPQRSYHTPQATIDAFGWVARNESTEYLARWLKQHPRDAAHLHDLWKSKCPQM